MARDEDGHGLTDAEIRDEVNLFLFAGICTFTLASLERVGCNCCFCQPCRSVRQTSLQHSDEDNVECKLRM